MRNQTLQTLRGPSTGRESAFSARNLRLACHCDPLRGTFWPVLPQIPHGPQVFGDIAHVLDLCSVSKVKCIDRQMWEMRISDVLEGTSSFSRMEAHIFERLHLVKIGQPERDVFALTE
jgi:hypothetical protein